MNKLYSTSNDTKNFITEVSTLTGYPQNMVREILEFFVLDWGIRLAEAPDDFAALNVPFMGNVNVKYNRDELLDSGAITTVVDSNIDFLPSFKKMVGDIHDQGYPELVPYAYKKVKQALAVSSNDIII